MRETGLSFPDVALLEPLAEALGLTVSALVAGEREALPREELVRDSLRTALDQWRPRVRRWRGLFFLAAGVLVLLALWRGFLLVRDRTEWLPQPQTAVTGRLSTTAERAAASTAGSNFIFFYDVDLSDGDRTYQFQLELWTGEGLAHTWTLPWYMGYGCAPEELDRHQPLAVTVERAWGTQEVVLGLSFLGPAQRYTLEGVFPPEWEGYAATPMEGRQHLDPDHGLILFQLDLGQMGENGGIRFHMPRLYNLGTADGQPPELYPQEAGILLLRMTEAVG